MPKVIPELRKLTKLSNGESALNEEIAKLPKDVQQNVYDVMRELLVDEITFVIQLEKQRLLVNEK